MLSILAKSKDPESRLAAHAESLECLSQLLAVECSTPIELNECGRDGLANILHMLSEAVFDVSEEIGLVELERQKAGKGAGE